MYALLFRTVLPNALSRLIVIAGVFSPAGTSKRYRKDNTGPAIADVMSTVWANPAPRGPASSQ